MQPRKNEIDPEISENDACETDDRQKSHPPSSPAPCIPGMEEDSVDNPRNERPGFFGVPTPIGAPCIAGPYRPREYACTEHGKTDYHASVVDFLKDIFWGHEREIQKIEDPAEKGNGKSGVGKKTGKDMNVEPVTLQGRDERLDGRRPQGRETHAEKGSGAKAQREKGGEHSFHDYLDEQQTPRVKNERFVEIGKWGVGGAEQVRLPPPDEKACRVNGEGNVQKKPRRSKDTFLFGNKEYEEQQDKGDIQYGRQSQDLIVEH
jgi:hypothetical protein